MSKHYEKCSMPKNMFEAPNAKQFSVKRQPTKGTRARGGAEAEAAAVAAAAAAAKANFDSACWKY